MNFDMDELGRALPTNNPWIPPSIVARRNEALDPQETEADELFFRKVQYDPKVFLQFGMLMMSFFRCVES